MCTLNHATTPLDDLDLRSIPRSAHMHMYSTSETSRDASEPCDHPSVVPAVCLRHGLSTPGRDAGESYPSLSIASLKHRHTPGHTKLQTLTTGNTVNTPTCAPASRIHKPAAHAHPCAPMELQRAPRPKSLPCFARAPRSVGPDWYDCGAELGLGLGLGLGPLTKG